MTMNNTFTEFKFSDLLIEPVRNGVYKPKEFHGRGCKIVNMGELFAYSRLFNVPMRRVELSEKEKEKSLLKEGDLLFARRSLVAEGAGKCSIVKELSEPTTFESSIIRARPDPTKASSDYLYYFFNSEVGRRTLGTILRQVAVSGITGTDLANLRLSLPSVATQQRIAELVSDLDDKIELNLQMNATLEATAQAIFKRWFVDFQFPGFDGELIDGLPRGWRIGDLSEQFNITMGQSPPGESYNETGQGIMFFQGRTDFGFRFPNTRMFTTDPKRFAKKFDTLVSVRAPVGDMNLTMNDCCIGRGLSAVRHRQDFFSYTYYLLNSMKDVFKGFEGEGTVFGSINKSNFERLEVTIADENVIKRFEDTVNPIDERIHINTVEIRTLTELRDGLLPKLMSGKIRVAE
jgi:type I restriction enzyme S subunit